MRTLAISYDLGGPSRNYDDLIGAIKGSGEWWHCLDSQWLVVTEHTASSMRDLLSVHLDDNDKIVVLKVATPTAWASNGMSKTCNDWLRTNVSRSTVAKAN